jgi:hypothetical protein
MTHSLYLLLALFTPFLLLTPTPQPFLHRSLVSLDPLRFVETGKTRKTGSRLLLFEVSQTQRQLLQQVLQTDWPRERRFGLELDYILFQSAVSLNGRREVGLTEVDAEQTVQQHISGIAILISLSLLL